MLEVIAREQLLCYTYLHVVWRSELLTTGNGKGLLVVCEERLLQKFGNVVFMQ
jgi:hypothetical protein